MEKEIKKEEAQIKANVESAKVEEKKDETQEVNTNIFKSFDVQPKTTSYGTSYVLKLKTHGDYEFEIRLAETQKMMIDEVGKDNCFVAVESRYSQDKRKAYSVVALHVGEIDVFDLFPRDRTTLSLARLHFDKYANK